MNEIQNELMHYGVLGMKWGIRRINKKILKAEKSGKSEKVAKLKKRLGEEKRIQQLKGRQKIFLSREGALANARLIDKGESAVSRFLQIRGTSFITSAAALGVGNVANQNIQKSSMFDNLSGGKAVAARIIASYGTSTVANVVGMGVADKMYKKMGS